VPGQESPVFLEAVGRELKARTDKLLGRSLHIREVDAGSCNGVRLRLWD